MKENRTDSERYNVRNYRRPVFSQDGIDYYADDDCHFFAYSGNSKIGHMTLEEDQATGNYWLENIGVNEGWRRKGIGRNLIQLAVDAYGKRFQVPLKAGASGNSYKYYFSGDDGINLINDCIRKRILSVKDNCSTYPPMVCAEEDDEDNGYHGADFYSDQDYGDERTHDEKEHEVHDAEVKDTKRILNNHKLTSPSRSRSSMFQGDSDTDIEELDDELGVDITDNEMADSAFGQGSNTALSFKKI